VRSHQMLHLPEEKNHSDEKDSMGDAMLKQLSPRRDFPADFAPKPMNTGPRPQPARMPRPMMPARPKADELEMKPSQHETIEKIDENENRAEKIRPNAPKPR
jgi:hypothetical protein